MVLEGQVAIVTGGGQGIGKAIALRLAAEGADIGIIDVNGKTAAATGEEIRKLNRRVVATVTDVADFHAVEAAVNEIVGVLGRVDVLVNNAGIEKRASFLEITPADWQRQLDVNLSGTFYCSQLAAREMAKRRYGRIVNVSSVAGLIGPIDLAAYGAAKAGIVGLTRASALDLADFGITVNAIAPGPIETELMLGVWSAEALRDRPQHGAIARFGTVERSPIRHSFWRRPSPALSPELHCQWTAVRWLPAPTWSRNIDDAEPPQRSKSRRKAIGESVPRWAGGPLPPCRLTSTWTEMLRRAVWVVVEIPCEAERELDGCQHSERQRNRPTQQPARACATGLRAPRPNKHAQQHRPAQQSESWNWQQNIGKRPIVIGSIKARAEGCDRCGGQNSSRYNQCGDGCIEPCAKAGVMQG